MVVMRGNSGGFGETNCQTAVMLVVLGCHCILLMLVSGSARDDRDIARGRMAKADVIQLRFLQRQQPAFLRVSAPAPVQSQLPRRRVSPRKTAAAVVFKREASAVDPPSEAKAARALSNGLPAAPETPDDGGFQRRLLQAAPGAGRPRLPGSGAPLISGLPLVDPMNQGIGAALRNAQRLFGVGNRHCIDVEAWRSVTPQERVARHISNGDVEQMDRAYACNAPPGLHF